MIVSIFCNWRLFKMKKINWKQYLIARLKIAGFILSVVGWFLLIIVYLEKIAKKDLSSLENFMQIPWANWGIKLLVVVAVILLSRGQSKFSNLIEKHPSLSTVLKIIIYVGVFGWIIVLINLYF